MNIKIITSILFSLALLVAFTSLVEANNVDITSITKNPVSGKPGDVITYTINVIGGDATPIGVSFATSAFTPTITGFTLPAITSLTALTNVAQTKQFAVTIPEAASAGTYTFSVTATGSDGQNNVENNVQLVVQSVKGIDVTSHSISIPLILGGEDGDVRTGKITVKNVGTETLGTFNFLKTDANFQDTSSRKAALTFGNLPSQLTPGQSAEVTITAAIERGMDLGFYTGDINLTALAGATSVQDQLKLEVRVQPEVCTKGPVGKLSVEIKEPDSGDEFAPGEEIDIEVTVDNDGSDDLDVTVEAFLYNLDKEDQLDSAEDSVDVDEGDSEDIDFTLTMTIDDDSKESDNYVIFVKAYEDGEEDTNCGEDLVEIDLNRETDDVTITSFTATPSTLACGNTASFDVQILNIGSDDQDNAFLELLQPELGLEKRSENFDLKKAGKDEESRSSYRTTFVVPRTAEGKDYNVEAVVNFDAGRKQKSEFLTLKVQCGGSASNVITLSSTSFDAQAGSTFVVPFTLRNSMNSLQVFTVEVSPVGGWAESATKQISVSASGSVSDSLTLSPSAAVRAGPYSASLTVKEANGNVVGTQTVNARITSGTTGPSFVTTSGSGMDTTTILLIAAVAVLVILIIVLVATLSGRSKREASQRR